MYILLWRCGFSPKTKTPPPVSAVGFGNRLNASTPNRRFAQQQRAQTKQSSVSIPNHGPKYSTEHARVNRILDFPKLLKLFSS
jgi:hypothetical protein